METDRVRRLWNKSAAGFDTSIAFYERRLFAGGREWACSQAADLRLGDAQQLDLPDASFDTVVCTLSLCSIPDDRRAVQEAWRVLRPNGRMVLMEHVRSPVWPVRIAQTVLDWITVRLEGDHQLREPISHLLAAGFEVEYSERLKWGIVERLIGRKPSS